MGVFDKLFEKKYKSTEVIEQEKTNVDVLEDGAETECSENSAVDCDSQVTREKEDARPETVVVTDAAKEVAEMTGKKTEQKKEHENYRLKVLLKELKENQTQMVTNMAFEEIVMNVRFVSPVLLSQQPIQNGDGTVTFTENTMMRMPMLTGADGKNFYAMFTDIDEFAQWESVKGTDTILLAFDDYAALMEKNEQAAGVVLNPFSDNLVLSRATMEQLKTQKDLRTKGVAKHKVTKDMQVMIGDPKEYPMELVEAVKRYLPGVPEVNRAWIRLMMKNNTPSLLMIVEQTGDKETIFKGIAEVAKPYLTKMYIDMVAYQDEFGKKAVGETKPFYEK